RSRPKPKAGFRGSCEPKALEPGYDSSWLFWDSHSHSQPLFFPRHLVTPETFPQRLFWLHLRFCSRLPLAWAQFPISPAASKQNEYAMHSILKSPELAPCTPSLSL